MESLFLPIPSPTASSKLWSSAILACLCFLGVFLSKAPSENPRYILLLRLEFQPIIKCWGSGMSLQPPSKAAEIYSCPSLLFSSKRQTVSLFIGGKKISPTVMVGET